MSAVGSKVEVSVGSISGSKVVGVCFFFMVEVRELMEEKEEGFVFGYLVGKRLLFFQVPIVKLGQIQLT